MKKLLLILLCLPLINLAQQTYVPDDNFEQALINLGYDNILDDSVTTGNINTVMYLSIQNQNISDLTGVGGFSALEYLECYNNQLTSLDLSGNPALIELECQDNQLASLDVSQNTYLIDLRCQDNQLTSLDVSANTFLEYLFCFSNQLTSLDVSNNSALIYLYSQSNQLVSLNVTASTSLYFLKCEYNQLTSLDVSTNNALQHLHCYSNQLTSLDVSNDTALIALHCQDNQLTSLDLRNGNNTNMPTFTISFNATNNPNLYCINVDSVAWSTTNWTVANGNINAQHYFSNNCPPLAFNCTDSLEVTDVVIDNSNLTMNIAIYNGYHYFLNYPYVAFTIDASGDTIQGGNINLFGALNLDTTWYNYSILSAINPTYPLTIYFVYSDGSLVTDTCFLTYNTTPTAITDINVNSNRKVIRIIDILGRENKGTKNEPLFYIYDDGTVEKRIVIE